MNIKLPLDWHSALKVAAPRLRGHLAWQGGAA
jgi:hypothetical protein